jgi:copper ion binding protein
MSTPEKTVLQVTGMSCDNCVRHVGAALRELAGVRAVDVQLASGRVSVEHEPARPSVEAMIEAVQEAGYEASAAS